MLVIRLQEPLRQSMPHKKSYNVIYRCLFSYSAIFSLVQVLCGKFVGVLYRECVFFFEQISACRVYLDQGCVLLHMHIDLLLIILV